MLQQKGGAWGGEILQCCREVTSGPESNGGLVATQAAFCVEYRGSGRLCCLINPVQVQDTSAQQL